MINSVIKPYTIWNRDEYLNIWVVNIKERVLGYATYPFSPADKDGIVVDYKSIGNTGTATVPYNLGRTATHEIGHWLNLHHIFENGCSGTSNSDCTTSGDRVCDTPPSSIKLHGCPETINTCTETPDDKNDITMNYMGYVDDQCICLLKDKKLECILQLMYLENLYSVQKLLT